MKRARRSISICLWLLPTAAPANVRPPTAVIAALGSTLKAGGGTSIGEALRRSVITQTRNREGWRADLKKAGREDWCGSAGCEIMLWLRDRHGRWTKAFDDNAVALHLHGDRRIVVRIVGSDGRTRRRRWDPAIGKLVSLR